MIYLSELNKKYYKPGDVGKILGINPMTVINYDNKGILSFDRTSTGRRIISRKNLIKYLKKCDLLIDDTIKNKVDIIYGRVSTHKQEHSGDLQRQIETVLSYVALQRPGEVVILKEVSSGLNDNRQQLNKLLKMVMNNQVNRIFILYKDRLTRFGYNYIKKICDYYNTEIIIVSDEESNKTVQEELAEDLCALIHSFSGKLYGLRSSQRKSIVENINKVGGIDEVSKTDNIQKGS